MCPWEVHLQVDSNWCPAGIFWAHLVWTSAKRLALCWNACQLELNMILFQGLSIFHIKKINLCALCVQVCNLLTKDLQDSDEFMLLLLLTFCQESWTSLLLGTSSFLLVSGLGCTGQQKHFTRNQVAAS